MKPDRTPNGRIICYLVQRTRNAHVNPPDSAFETVSKHWSWHRAMDAFLLQRKERARRCGPGVFDCNIRIRRMPDNETVA